MKPVILFNFGYHRRGWISPIESLANEIDIVYLYYVTPQQETFRYTNHRVIYWSDYQDVHGLLDDVRPDKVVFMSIDSGVGILLNYTARRRHIRTYILQHGIYSHYRDYREREHRTRRLGLYEDSVAMTVKEFSTLRFYRQSLNLRDLVSFLKFPVYFWLSKRAGPRFACRWVRFDARMPDYYICYTPQNAIIHKELDAAPQSKFFYVGNPEMDLFFNSPAPIQDPDSYYLLIDQPLADNRYGEHICSREQMINHYLRLNDFCLSQHSKLKVKLHPESYHSEWLPISDNIDWIKEHSDMPGLIKNAQGCFGYFSTLLIPAIRFNRCVIFKVSENEMQLDAARMGLIELLDFFDYSPQDIDFSHVKKDNLNIFVKKYLLFDDGRSVHRLKEILLK